MFLLRWAIGCGPNGFRCRETHWRQSVDREVLAVRQGVGVCDVTTLGKIDVQGRDAAEFLNLVYASGFKKLPVVRRAMD